MLDATKVKPQRVAVLEVLRPEGVLLLTKYSAKMQSLTRREFTRRLIVVCAVGRHKPYYSVYGISLPMLDHGRPRFLDARRDKSKTPKGCCTRGTAPYGVLVLTKYSAKMQSLK